MCKIFHTIVIVIISAGLAFSQSRVENYQKLKEYYDQEDLESLMNAESLLGVLGVPADTTAANAYYYVAYAYYMNGNLDKALALYEKELSVRSAFENKITEDFSNNLYNLLNIYLEKGDIHSALKYADALLNADETLYGKGSEQYYDSFNFYIELLIQGTDYQTALRQLNKLKISEIEDLYFRALFMTKKGDVLNLMGHYSEAEAILIEASILFDRSGFVYESILTDAVRGLVLINQGRYPEAEEIYITAQKKISSFEGEDVIATQDDLLNNLAIIYMALARFDDALNVYNDILERDEERSGKTSPDYLASMINQGMVYYYKEDYTKAENLFNEAISINNDVYGPESWMQATIKNNLANTYRLSGRLEEALRVYNESSVLFKELEGKKNVNLATVHFNLGKTMLMKNDKKAEQYLKTALKMRGDLLGEQHPKYAEVTNHLAMYYWKVGDRKKALKYFDDTFLNYFNQIRSFFGVLSEEEKTKFYNATLKPTFEQFNSFVVAGLKDDPNLLGKLYDYQLRTKGLIMYATDKVRRNIYERGDAALIEQYESWRLVKERISKLYSSNDPSVQETIDSLANQANTLERGLVQKSAAFASTYDEKIVSWQEVRDHLEPGEAAMEIIRFRKFTPVNINQFTEDVQYLGLLITPESQNHPTPILIEDGLLMESRYLTNYRNSIVFQIEDDVSYQQYWQPFSKELNAINTLYLSADGVYNQLNLSTIKVPSNGKYLIDEIKIRPVTNTKELVLKSPDSSGKANKSYLIGFPAYKRDGGEVQASAEPVVTGTTRGGNLRGLRGGLLRYLRSGEGITPLPGTKTEVEGIVRMYNDKQKDYETVMQTSATESELKSLKNPEILHIATHGYFLETPESSEIEMEEKYFEDPLLRSGIVLAGAEDFLVDGNLLENGEDGILTAYEAMNLDLNNTDLVVLSACETGLGTIQNGEGVYGLQRAFTIAGAKSIIMSLWNVDDDATQELMTLFYNNWLSGQNRFDAFYNAQIELKEKYKQPFYWGAFILVGK